MSEIDWSKAPEGATHCAPEGLSREPRVCWYRRHEDRWEYFSPNRREWRRSANGQEFHDRLIPRPTQWRGPEDGLPPVGTVCEARHHGGWAECEIIAHVRAPENCIEAVYQAADDWDWLSSPSNFRPLKSDKERAVEAALSAAGYSIDGPCNDEVRSIVKALRRAYSAGLLRLPEEQS